MPNGQFGGRISFNFDGLVIPPCDGNFVIDPSTLSSDAIANGDGSAAYIYKPELVGAEMKLRNVDGIDWTSIINRTGNAQIVEENNGRSHLFTGTRMVGKPALDVSTGEVSGLKLMGGQYLSRVD